MGIFCTKLIFDKITRNNSFHKLIEQKNFSCVSLINKNRIMKKLLVLFIILAFVSCNSGNRKVTDEKSAVTSEEFVEATVNIGGMHCEMCVASVEKGVNELDGIESVAVSLTDSTAIVKYDASQVDLTKIGKAIEKRGYSIK